MYIIEFIKNSHCVNCNKFIFSLMINIDYDLIKRLKLKCAIYE